MGRRIVVGLVVLMASARCGLDESGLDEGDAAPSFDGGKLDATLEAASDAGFAAPIASPLDVVVDVAPKEAGPCDEDGNACEPPAVPAGWAPVAYLENPN